VADDSELFCEDADTTLTDLPYAFGELARQCLRHRLPRSTILHNFAPLEKCLRSAVVADLYLSGRIVNSGGLRLDTDATGDVTTDTLLTFVSQHPDWLLSDLLADGPSVRDEVTESLIIRGIWKRRSGRRFREMDPDSIFLTGSEELADVIVRGQSASILETSLAVLLLPWKGIDDRVYARCGAASEFLKSYTMANGFVKQSEPTGWGQLLTIPWPGP